MCPPDHLQESLARENNIYKPAICPHHSSNEGAMLKTYDTHKSAIRSTDCTIPPKQSLSLRPLVHDPGHCALSAGTGSLFNVLVRQSNQNRLPFAQLICCSLSLKPANSTGRYILHSPPPFR